MATVLLRFYGRFAIAEGKNDDNTPCCKITVLAPRYNIAKFNPHEPLMWIRRSAVVTIDPKANGSPVTNLAPSHRIACDDDITRSECFVWDLSGRTVQVRDRQIAELPKNHGIADLADLVRRRMGSEPNLDRESLNGSTRGATSAAVRVAGSGGTGSAFPGRCDFVALSDAIADKKDPDTFGTTVTQYADFVEFEIGLNAVDACTKNAPLLTLELTDPDGVQFTKQIVVNALNPVTIGFSNRSTMLPMYPPFDLEFGQYYDLLTDQPNDPLIPREAKGSGELGDCDRLAYIPYNCSA